MTVTDPDDARVAPYRDLKARARDPRRDPGRFVVEGETAVVRLLASAFAVESVLTTPTRLERLRPHLRPGLPVLVAPPDLLLAITGVDLHRGCVALARRPAPGPVALPPADRPRTTIVAAQGLGDPVNVGALVRDCRAFAADLLLLDARGADPFAPRAVRAAMGHVFAQPLAVVDDLEAEVAGLRASGRRVLAATLSPGATPLPRLVRPDHVVLLLGHEDQGLRPSLLALADEEVTIPLAPGVDSLNVAAAAAVLLYALTARDRLGPP
ncbi:MAG: RNA methyltransferase [Planctomycetes bacterium]|nr:RNA methyltransferase [Planctomycetota bacterium]